MQDPISIPDCEQPKLKFFMDKIKGGVAMHNSLLLLTTIFERDPIYVGPHKLLTIVCRVYWMSDHPTQLLHAAVFGTN